MQRSLVMIMAGGRGKRLGPLTCHRAKPATPFAGRYRIIDFVLSNFVNSGYRQIYILTQYMSASLIRHLSRAWYLAGYDEFIELAPAQMRRGKHWYLGTADSVYQNFNLIYDQYTPHVAVFGGDHIYKCAVDQIEKFHLEVEADLTIMAYPVPREEAHHFGVMRVDDAGRVVGFDEKPENPQPIPGQPDTCLVSMGNYFFRTEVLERALSEDSVRPESGHDFGRDIIPALLEAGAQVYAYDFRQNHVPGEAADGAPYWRDVGTIDSYIQASMELRNPVPALNMYNRHWRIRTAHRHHPPARFVRDKGQQAADLEDAMICEGAVLSGANVLRSIIGYDCFLQAGAVVEDSLLLSGCSVGANAKLRRVLADKNCTIAADASIGVDPEADRARFPYVTESGVIVLPKGTYVPAEGAIEMTQDIVELLSKDPATREALSAVTSLPTISDRGRHSHWSAGPGATAID